MPTKPHRTADAPTPAATVSPSSPTPEEFVAFRRLVDGHYHRHGRSFPWRETTAPYAILVSEFMLQQTQTARVLEPYEKFLAAFPDFATLAAAPPAAVLSHWQGLGYNRRARYLQRLAAEVVDTRGGHLPETEPELLQLPGIGPATAAAVSAFAFSRPAILIETNIRTVYIHHFFAGRETVHDREIRPLVAATVDRDDPRSWYYALMDYGVALKQRLPNPSRRSRHHQRQSTFAGSTRQLRGLIIKTLLGDGEQDFDQLAARLPFPADHVRETLTKLVSEGMIREGEELYGPPE
ncbi:MAG: A/G-specific adenine glycosylase [Deltaproteobacteria bacterium]|nr:A/G-specific adenine glycosylase [Candidatus Anaeroferrophillacea bacterium]